MNSEVADSETEIPQEISQKPRDAVQRIGRAARAGVLRCGTDVAGSMVGEYWTEDKSWHRAHSASPYKAR